MAPTNTQKHAACETLTHSATLRLQALAAGFTLGVHARLPFVREAPAQLAVHWLHDRHHFAAHAAHRLPLNVFLQPTKKPY